jgi:hypothetical protein
MFFPLLIPRILAAAWAAPFCRSSCFCAYCLSFLAWLASRLATFSGMVTPLRSLRRLGPTTSAREASKEKRRGGNWHYQPMASSSGLTQGLMNPSLMETRLGMVRWFTTRARIHQTWVSTFASSNSACKERLGQPCPRYLHGVISHRRSGWTRWLTKV